MQRVIFHFLVILLLPLTDLYEPFTLQLKFFQPEAKNHKPFVLTFIPSPFHLLIRPIIAKSVIEASQFAPPFLVRNHQKA